MAECTSPRSLLVGAASCGVLLAQAPFTASWDQSRSAPLPAIARPTDTFYGTGTMPFGDERIDYGDLLQAPGQGTG